MAEAVDFRTPLLRVSRPVSACQRCRGAKIKCDGKLPACTACEKAGRSEECSSAIDHFAKGKERSYVTSLENQIEKLELRLSQANPVEATTIACLSPAKQKSAKREANNVDDLVSDFGFLSVNATSRDFHGFAGEMSFARLVLSMSSLEPMAFTHSTFSLPPRYAITLLIQHYVDNINVMYPFLSEASIFRSVDMVFAQGGLYASPLDHWITLMVVAISHASQVQCHGDFQYQQAIKYMTTALEYVEHVVRPGSRSGIQAMLLMVLFSLWVPHHYNSWYLIGIVSRAAVDLGLHHDPPDEFRSKTAGSVTGGSIFECVYSLDRYVSMVYRRSFSFTDQSINLNTLHEQRKLNSRPMFSNSVKPAEDVANLRQIQSNSYQTLFQSTPLSLRDAWAVIRAGVNDVAQWCSVSSSSQDDQVLRDYYHCESLYAIFLMMTPTCANNMPPHGKILVLQYAMEYGGSVYSFISHTAKRTGLYTSLDLHRISSAAQKFVTLLKSNHKTVFSTSPPTTPTAIGDSGDHLHMDLAWPLLRHPLLLSDDVVGRLRKVRQSLEIFDIIIAQFCSVYGYTDPMTEYRASASTLKLILNSEY